MSNSIFALPKSVTPGSAITEGPHNDGADATADSRGSAAQKRSPMAGSVVMLGAAQYSCQLTENERTTRSPVNPQQT